MTRVLVSNYKVQTVTLLKSKYCKHAEEEESEEHGALNKLAGVWHNIGNGAKIRHHEDPSHFLYRCRGGNKNSVSFLLHGSSI